MAASTQNSTKSKPRDIDRQGLSVAQLGLEDGYGHHRPGGRGGAEGAKEEPIGEVEDPSVLARTVRRLTNDMTMQIPSTRLVIRGWVRDDWEWPTSAYP